MNNEFKQIAEIAYRKNFNIGPENYAERIALLSTSNEIMEDRLMACEIVNKIIGEYLIENESLASLQNMLSAVGENIRAKAESEDERNNARAFVVAHYVEQALRRYSKEGGTPKFTVIEGGLEDQ